MTDQTKLEAIFYLASKSQFHILECEALAKALDAGNRMHFELVGPKGRMECRWLDAHYGIFERIDDIDSKAFHTKQFQFVQDVHCENLENFS
jgi:hypothetical protein